MYDAVLFDVDGTIIDTEQVVISSLQQVLKSELGLTVSAPDLTFILGIPGRDALKHFVDSAAELDRLGQLWSDTAATMSSEYQLFPEITEIIQALKNRGITVGIVTSKTDHEYQAEVTPFGLDDLLELILTASDTKKHKPDPEPIKFAINRLNIPATKLLYVGDTLYDMHAAQQAGAHFAVAEWGAHDRSEFQQAQWRPQRPMDLMEVLK